jgi:hypothetical protein
VRNCIFLCYTLIYGGWCSSRRQFWALHNSVHPPPLNRPADAFCQLTSRLPRANTHALRPFLLQTFAVSSCTETVSKQLPYVVCRTTAAAGAPLHEGMDCRAVRSCARACQADGWHRSRGHKDWCQLLQLDGCA